MAICPYLVPGHDAFLGHKCCLRRDRHKGPHVIKDDKGQLIAWEHDYECVDCDPPEDCECFTYGDLSDSEARQLLGLTAADPLEP